MTRQNALTWLKSISLIGVYGGLLMPLMFLPVVIFPFVFSKLIFFQVLIGLTFPAYLILAWAEPRYRPWSSMLYLAIAAYFVALGLSVVFSVDVYRSWWGNQERMNGLFTLLHFFAWLTMVTGVLKTWPQWKRLLNFQITLSGFMACVALLQKVIPNLLLFPAGERVGGLLDNPIYMGAYQIFNFFFIALLWMKGPSRTTKMWYAAILFLDIGAFIAAQSRGALVGLGAGLIVFAIAYGLMTENKKAKRWVFGAVALCFAAYGLLFALRNTGFVQATPLARFVSFSSATRTRLIAWDIAWKGFLDRPLTGWGLDTFHVLFNEKYNPESLRFGYYETWFDRSHNTVMDILSMTGLFGFVTFIFLFGALFWSVIRARRKGWIDASMGSVLLALPIAYFVQNLFVFDHPAAFSMSFLMYALVICATTARFNEKGEEDGSVSDDSVKAHPVPWIAFGILELTMFGLVWTTSIIPFRVSMKSIASNTYFGAGDYDTAFRLAKEAAVPWTPYVDEQTFLQARNFISLSQSPRMKQLSYWREWHDLIISLTERQQREHPRNTNPTFIYARFAETMSQFVPEDLAIAEAQYKKAIELSPKRQQLYYAYGHFLIAHGRNEEATDLLKKVVSFDEQIGESHWLLGLHQYFDLRDTVNGAREIVQAMTVERPYHLKDAREALALSMVYDGLGDKEGLKSVIQMLPDLPQADINVYVQIAKIMEHQGLTEERNLILNALVRLDQKFAQQIQPLANGSVTSIQAALSLPIPTATSTAPTATTTSKTGGSGPRR